MRLIDADALIGFIVEEAQDLRTLSTKTVGQAISKTPTIDAVPVIRCKDCKYYADECCDRYADETLGYVHSTQEYGFCWVAERKEE